MGERASQIPFPGTGQPSCSSCDQVRLAREIKAMLHPDKVQHPEAKVQLHEVFEAFKQATTPPRMPTAPGQAKRRKGSVNS